jgi:hypothetical protein
VLTISLLQSLVSLRKIFISEKFRKVSVCTTIIDKDIVWYGAINALGYATEEDNVIKVVDNKLANELLEVLLTS